MEIWLQILGLGMGFQGALILWVGGIPMAFRSGDKPVAEKGSAKAFGLFWIDQYRYIGLVLLVLGLALTLAGYAL